MVRIETVPFIEKADGRWTRPRGYHRFIKRKKARAERRRAKANPECTPCYGRYRGWET